MIFEILVVKREVHRDKNLIQIQQRQRDCVVLEHYSRVLKRKKGTPVDESEIGQRKMIRSEQLGAILVKEEGN